VTDLQQVVEQRISRLPRAMLTPHTELEQSMLDRIRASPTYKTARQDIEFLFKDDVEAVDQEKEREKLAREETSRQDRIDWTQYARLLVGEQTVTEPLSGRRLEMDKSFVNCYAGDVENANMWIHHAASGTEVHIIPGTASSDGKVELCLRGSARSVYLTEQRLRYLETEYQLSGPRPSWVQFQQGPWRSSISSVQTFSEYVSRLVSFRIPRQAQQASGDTRIQQIGATLLRLFLDPRASKYASAASLQTAMVFLSRRLRLWSTFDTLYSRGKIMRLKLTVGGYNSLIKSAMTLNKHNHVAAFIKDMQEMRIQPDPQTWALFLGAAQGEDQRKLIISLVNESVKIRPLVDGEDVLAATVEQVTATEPNASKLSEELADFDAFFGTTWFTLKTYRRMVLALKRRKMNKLGDLSADLLEIPTKRSMVHGEEGWHIGVLRLALYRRQLDAEASVKELCWLVENYDQQRPGRLAVPVGYAFVTAWERMWPNVCRVLWRHAMSHGNILYKMQSFVVHSLLQNARDSTEPKSIWLRQAGCLVAGHNGDTTGLGKVFPRLSQHCADLPNALEWLTRYTPDDGTRDEQISLAYYVLNQDLRAWQQHERVTGWKLLSLLQVAMEMDRRWIEQKKLTVLPFSQQLEEVIEIPLTPKKASYYRSIPLIGVLGSDDAFQPFRRSQQRGFIDRSNMDDTRSKSPSDPDFDGTSQESSRVLFTDIFDSHRGGVSEREDGEATGSDTNEID
jgi:hypothetical protein